MAYTTDLTQKEYQILQPLLPVKSITRPPIWTKHQILNGIFYQLVNGCQSGCGNRLEQVQTSTLADGLIYQRTYHHTQQYSTITTSGRKMVSGI